MLTILAIILIGALIGFDQYTKSRARIELKDQKIKGDYITLSLVKNKGAFRGLLGNSPIILLVFQSIGVVFVFALLIIQLITKKDKLLVLGLSFLVAGGIGNLIDRLTNGYVTDFFAFKWTKNLYYNLADMFIFIGALMTVIKGNKL